MRITIILNIVFSLMGCNQKTYTSIYVADENRYSIANGKSTGNGLVKKEVFKNGKIHQKGKYAIDIEGKLSGLKVGIWVRYYENGQLKEQGSYEIGAYIQCCFSGSCKQFYNFKIGKWKYLYPNGKTKAIGEYEIVNLHVDTNCEGGDDLLFGILTDEWTFFNENGIQINLNDSLRLELETVHTGGTTLASYFVPDKERKNIKMHFDH